MKRFNKNKFIILFWGLAIFLSGCGGMETIPPAVEPLPRSDDYRQNPIQHDFRAVNLEPKIKRQRLSPKIEQLFVLIDKSDALSRPYNGKSRHLWLKQTFQNFQHSIPKSLQFKQQILMFGLNQKERFSAVSDLSAALKQTEKHIKKGSNKTAILILSEWDRVKPAVQNQTLSLFRAHPELCIYMIGIGNIHKDLALKPFHQCGNTHSADKLLNPNEMSDFVEAIFYSDSADQDGDGIYDFKDQCPNSPPQQPINWQGCPRNSHRSHPLYQIPEASELDLNR